jgi:hypothetical protein
MRLAICTLAALLALSRGAATEACPAGEHADPLATFILTAEKATLLAVDKAKNLYRLTVPLAAAVPTTPYVINSYPEGLQQGVLATARFVRDWASLSKAADYGKGRYARPQYAADLQCAASKNVLDASKAEVGSIANNVMIIIHGSPYAIVADVYNVEVAKGVATFSLRWIRAPKDTPDFGCHKVQDVRDPHYHHRPIAGCELEIAEDIVLPGAALREGARGATLFIKVWVLGFLSTSQRSPRPPIPASPLLTASSLTPPVPPHPLAPLGAASQRVSRPRRALQFVFARSGS